MNHPSVEGTNAGNRHSIKLYFLPQRGKSVTRRALFPGSCFPGGLGCGGACAFPGLLAELFPFETQGRLEVGNVGPWCSHRRRATPARPQDGARPGAGTVRGPERGQSWGPARRRRRALRLPVGLGVQPRPCPNCPSSPEGPQPRPAPPATSETGQGTLASGPGAVPRPQLSSSLACTGHSVPGRPCHGWGSESPAYAVPQGAAGGGGRQPSRDHTATPGPHGVPPGCVGHGVVKEQWCRLHVGSAVRGEWPVTPVRSLGTWGCRCRAAPSAEPQISAGTGGCAPGDAGVGRPQL